MPPEIQYGSSDTADVTNLQKFLAQNGFYAGPIDGKFGPLTQGAVKTFQGHTNIKVDGIVGPQTWGQIQNYGKTSASGTGTPSNPDGTGSAADQAYYDSEYQKDLAEISPSYDQAQANASYDEGQGLAKDQADYQNYLDTSAQNFKNDKNAADETSAKNGVLFSTGRTQGLSNLQNTYNSDQKSKLADYTNDIDTSANDFQYKYGNNAANSLSQYYGLGSNKYNAQGNEASVKSGGVSPVYNPSASNYAGTQNSLKSYYAYLMANGQLGAFNNTGQLNGNNWQY